MVTLVKAKIQAQGKDQVMVVGVIPNLPCNLMIETDFPLKVVLREKDSRRRIR